MRTQNSSTLASANGVTESLLSDRGSPGICSPDPEKRTILLISSDTKWGQNLRSVANAVGRMVVRVDGAADVLRILYAVRPAVVLLDLDLPAEAAWEKADSLLQEQRCPPVILLTARKEQSDVRTAIQAGSLVDKSREPAHLLDLVDRTLAMADSPQTEQNAIQRAIVRWLKPCSRSVPVAPAYRFWGINE